jgi:RNA polymerase sigma-70 factor (ECF subfamily)
LADSSIGFEFDACLGLPRADAAEAAEEQLVEGLRHGSEAAYETLIQRYQQPVYNLIYRLMNDPSDTCDVVQEVFLKVFRNLNHFRGQSHLKTWIYRIAVNEAYNHRRWFSRHRKQEVGFEAEQEDSLGYEDVLADASQSAFDAVLGRETHALIEKALLEVNPAFRAAVVLRDIEDMSYEEIAEVLQVSLGTVKSRIMRGRESLRKILASRLQPETGADWQRQPARVRS